MRKFPLDYHHNIETSKKHLNVPCSSLIQPSISRALEATPTSVQTRAEDGERNILTQFHHHHDENDTKMSETI